MKKMNEKSMKAANGGKKKKCPYCGKKFTTWFWQYSLHVNSCKNSVY